MSVTISLVAPCLNEEGNVATLAERFLSEAKNHKIPVEIVFVDDGSTDSTADRILELQNQHGSMIRLISHDTNLGIPAAWSSGCEASCGKYVCLIDSDLQNRPEDVFRLLKCLIDTDADFVQAIRRPSTKQSWMRIGMSRMLNWILNASFSMSASDNKSGFVLAERTKLQRVLIYQGDYKHFQTFVGVAAHHHGYRIAEVETYFDDRRSGSSFLIGKSWKVAREVISDIRIARNEFGTKRDRRV